MSDAVCSFRFDKDTPYCRGTSSTYPGIILSEGAVLLRAVPGCIYFIYCIYCTSSWRWWRIWDTVTHSDFLFHTKALEADFLSSYS